MSKRRPRVVLTIVTDESSVEFAAIAGRDVDGQESPGPTDEQFAIAFRALASLMGTCVESPSR